MEASICDNYKNDLDKFEKWVKSRPALPQNTNRLLLLRYLKVCDFDQEKARKLFMYNLELRAEYPNHFTERDIKSEKLQTALRCLQVCTLPTYTSEKHKITFFRVGDTDHSKYDVVDTFKVFYMVADASFVTPDPEHVGLSEGEIGIMDFSGFTFRHFFKMATNLSSLRLYLKYIQEAVPFKIHQNHFVNCSYVLTKVMTLVRPFIKKELFDVMHFHTSGFESLYEHVPREILPEEYGGDAGKFEEIYEKNVKGLEAQRDYVNDDSNWQISEQ